MIYLDSHIVVWLYAGEMTRFTKLARNLVNSHEPYVSPIVRLELQYLFEMNRISIGAAAIVADLSTRIGLRVSNRDFNAIVGQAMGYSWTRDPFDRLIVANAGINNDVLITKDQSILDNYGQARW